MARSFPVARSTPAKPAPAKKAPTVAARRPAASPAVPPAPIAARTNHLSIPEAALRGLRGQCYFNGLMFPRLFPLRSCLYALSCLLWLGCGEDAKVSQPSVCPEQDHVEAPPVGALITH